MKSKNRTELPIAAVRIKRILHSSLAKCFYLSFCFSAVTALFSSVRNNTADDPSTVVAIIGLALYYLVSPLMAFIYGIMRQKKYGAGHRLFLSGIIVALAAAWVYPIFLWIGTGARPVQGIFLFELLPISMEEYIPVRQFVAFIFGSSLMKLIQYIIRNKAGANKGK